MGFVTKSFAPLLNAFSISLSEFNAERITTGIFDVSSDLLRAAKTSKPSTFGIIKSKRTSEGFSAAIISSASCPPFAFFTLKL